MQDEERSVIRTLYVFMSVALAGSAVVFISALVLAEGVYRSSLLIAGAVGMVTSGVCLWLLRLEQFTIPRILLPSAAYLLATYLIFTGNTVAVRDDAVLMYALVVALAGLLLRRRGVVIFGSLSVMIVVAAVDAEINGVIVNRITTNTSTYATMVTVGVTYGLTFTMMYTLVNILSKNLARSRSEQQQLELANDELLRTHATLEQLVETRTRAAEKARSEAETARGQAEAQAWFTRGQAQLAEQMRGDLDIVTLANRITSHLTQYIGAQSGALYLASSERLKLTGQYAPTTETEQKSEFRLGEGLVGEAARSKKMIHVKDIPADAPRISTTPGTSIPREILIIPLESNGQIFGVLEFATLTRFTLDHVNFLQRVSESASIALRSAQTRAQMKQLLGQL